MDSDELSCRVRAIRYTLELAVEELVLDRDSLTSFTDLVSVVCLCEEGNRVLLLFCTREARKTAFCWEKRCVCVFESRSSQVSFFICHLQRSFFILSPKTDFSIHSSFYFSGATNILSSLSSLVISCVLSCVLDKTVVTDNIFVVTGTSMMPLTTLVFARVLEPIDSQVHSSKRQTIQMHSRKEGLKDRLYFLSD